MRAGRGEGCVLKPVRPVGMLASRNLLTDLTVAKSCEELLMVSKGHGVGVRGRDKFKKGGSANDTRSQVVEDIESSSESSSPNFELSPQSMTAKQ